jgi:hypothetical protein
MTLRAGLLGGQSALSMVLRQTRPSGRGSAHRARPPAGSCRPPAQPYLGHRSVTSSTMWVDRMMTTFSPISASRFRKRLRSSGSRPAVGSSTMISFGVPDQGLGDAEALAHPAREARQRLAAHRPQVDLVQQGCRPSPCGPCRWRSPSAPPCDRACRRPKRADRRRNPGADSRARRSCSGSLITSMSPKSDGTRGRGLQGGDRPHQRRLARAVRAQQSEHSLGNAEADVVQRPRTVAVDVDEILYREHLIVPY